MPALSSLLAPRSIAVVGASAARPTAGTTVIANLRRLNYQGAIYPVNPKYDTIDGLRCYPSLADIPTEVDAAFLGVPAEGVLPLLEEAGGRGIRAVVVTASGFADAGPEGASRQAALATAAATYGVSVCGPNNMGIINWLDGVAIWTGTLTPPPRTGPIGVISQSGSVAMLCAADDRDIGLGMVINSGNEPVLSSAEYLAALVCDDRIRVILHFLETVNRPDEYAMAAEDARRRGKTIAVLKVGRTQRGRQAAIAHTGSLAGNDEEFDAFCRQLGLVRVETLDEMLEFAELSTKTAHAPGRPGVCLIAMSGWEVALLSDLATEADLPLAELSAQTRDALVQIFPRYSTISNPLDAWGAGWNPDTYRAALRALAHDPAVGVVACAIDPDARNGRANTPVSLDMARIHLELLDGSPTDGPSTVFFNNVSSGLSPVIRSVLDGTGIAYLQGMPEAVRALAHWVRFHTPRSHARHRARRESGGGPDADRVVPPVLLQIAMRSARGRVIGERDTATLLAAYGIPMTRASLARSAAEALRQAAAIGYPVVLKAASPLLPHKSDVGGVILGVRSAAEVRRGYRAIVDRVRRANPEVALEGILVAEMVPPGLEIMLGVSTGPYGSMVLVGHGGTDVEVARDVAYALTPVDSEEALAMLKRLRLFPRLAPSRDRPERDVAAVVEMIVNVSRVAEECGAWLAALDINPVIVHASGDGARAVDALCILRDTL